MSDINFEFEVSAGNRDGEYAIQAFWNGRTYPSTVKMMSGGGRTFFFRQLARQAGCEADELILRYDQVIVELAAAKDRALDDEQSSVATEEKVTRSLADQLVELIDADCELWRTPDDEPFVTIRDDGYEKHVKLRSVQFRSWFAQQAYRNLKRVPNANVLKDALNVLVGRALHEGDVHVAHLRIAVQDGKRYIDLCDETWRAVEIDAHGWRILDHPPVRFRRTKTMQQLPEPARGGTIELLRPFVNADDDNFHLLVAWLVDALRFEGPHPLLALFGAQGTGKSTIARICRSLVDPNKSPLRSEPRDVRDLAVATSSAWCVCLDNLSAVQSWLSDALCRLATGGGFSTRMLHTDDEEVIFDFCRPQLVTAIEDVAERSDLLERALIVQLQTIDELQRRPESEIYAEFEKVRPLILGALFDAVAGGIARLPTTTLTRLPRMADFCRWVVACEGALGWDPGAFEHAYQGSRREATNLGLEASPIAPYVRELADRCEQPDRVPIWKGTPTELLAELNRLAGHDEKGRPPKGWPTNSRLLSQMLKRIQKDLADSGVTVMHTRTGGARLWHVCKGNPASPASFAGNYGVSSVTSDAGDADDARSRSLFDEADPPLPSDPPDDPPDDILADDSLDEHLDG